MERAQIPTPSARPRSKERLARLQGRHRIPWLAGRRSVGLVALLMIAPLLFFAFIQVFGKHTSTLYTPGTGWVLAPFWLLILVLVVLASKRTGQTKLWRARRRRPWWTPSLRAGPPLSCAYCHDGLSGEGEEVHCPDCGGAYHEECQAELGRCASLGCQGLGPGPELGLARKITLHAPKLGA